MSESSGTKPDKNVGTSIFLLIGAAVLLRVWYVAEQLRNHHPSSMSSTWVDVYGNSQTISVSTAPGRPFEEFLVEFESNLSKAQREFPRKP